MSVGAGILQVGRAKKRSPVRTEEEGIHVSPASAWPPPKGHCHTVTLKQPLEYLSTRDSSGRVREKLKCCKKLKPKMAVQASKKCNCHHVGYLQRQPITRARDHRLF